MKNINMNNVDYTSVSSGGQSEVTWEDSTAHSVITGGNESEALEYVVLKPIKDNRDKLLQESDWRVMVSDYPSSDIEEWKSYRQLLRDLPSTYVEGEDISLPTKP